MDRFKRLTESQFNTFGVEGVLDGQPVSVVISSGVETWDEHKAVSQNMDTARFKDYEVSTKQGMTLEADGRKFTLGQVMKNDGYVMEREVIRAGKGV